MKYVTELTKSMDFLAKDKRIIFLGQAVAYPGTGMTNTLKNVSLSFWLYCLYQHYELSLVLLDF